MPPTIREDIIARVRLEGTEKLQADARRAAGSLDNLKRSAMSSTVPTAVRGAGALRPGQTHAQWVAQMEATIANMRRQAALLPGGSAEQAAIAAAATRGAPIGGRGVLGLRGRAVATAVGGGRYAGLAAPFGGMGPLLGIAAGYTAISQIGASVRNITENQQLTAQTVAGIKSTGGAAGVTAKHIDNLAVSLGHLSGQQDEAVHGAENILLTFPKIRNEGGKLGGIFDQTTLAVANVAARMGTDLPQAALQIGKAINDPVRGMGALRRIGVQFTRQQEEQIKVAVAAGRADDARKIILQELNTEFGHSAELAGKTLPGAMTNLGEAWEDARNKLVIALIPALTVFVNWLAVKIPQAAKATERAFDFLDNKRDRKGTLSHFLAGLPGGSTIADAWEFGNRPGWKVGRDTINALPGGGFSNEGGITERLFGDGGRSRRDAQGRAERERQRQAVGGIMLDANGNPTRGMGQSWEKDARATFDWTIGDPLAGRDVILVADGQKIASLVNKAQQKRAHSEGRGTSQR